MKTEKEKKRLTVKLFYLENQCSVAKKKGRSGD